MVVTSNEKLEDRLNKTLLSCGCIVVIYNFRGLCFSFMRVVYSEDAVFLETPFANIWYGKLLMLIVEFLSTVQVVPGEIMVVGP